MNIQQSSISRETLLAALDGTDFCLAILSGAELCFDLVNVDFERIHPGTVMLGRRFRDVFPLAAAQGFEKKLLQVLETGEPWRLQRCTAPTAAKAAVVWDGRVTRLPKLAGGRDSVLVVVKDVTEQDRMDRVATERNAALETEHGRLLATVDRITDGLLVLDREWRYTFVSARASRIIGIPGDKLLGGCVWELFPQAFGTRFHEGYLKAMATGEPQHFEEYYPAPLELWLECHCYPSPEGLTVYFHDTTARHLADDELQKIAAKTRELSRTWEANPDLLSVIDSEGRFERTNPAWSTVLGYSDMDLHEASFSGFVHPEDLASSREALAKAQGGEPVLRFENRYRTKAGGYRWLSWVAVPENGRVYCSTRDIDAEKQQAMALERSVAEHDRIWQNSQALIVVIDLDGSFKSINPAVTRVLGWRSEELLGRSVLDLIHPDDLPPHDNGRLLAERYASPLTVLNRWRHQSGGYRHVEWVSGLDGDLIYSFGRDVSRETEQASALKVAEDSLRQSQKMEAVGQLTGGIAHDFNNLLAAVSGSLEVMQSRIAQGRGEQVERYVIAAQGAVKRAASLTHRLLAFSRRQTLDPKPVNVNRLLADMEDLVRRTVGPSIELEVVGAGGLWTTLIDANQLENAILNLCINARDAMPNGGRITIETANKWLDVREAIVRDVPPGQYLSLCVTDTGTGMTPDVAAKAFDPFFTTKPLGMGTGLGLSMIYGFVRQSGGQVRIYSELNHGTTMCLYLPRHLGDDVETPCESQPVEGALAKQGETVLVVDDEPTVRMLIAEVLEDAGFVVLEAADGRSGLKILTSDVRIDLLVSDVGLPGGMNGRQMADAARLNRPRLKVLFITGYAENAVVGNGHLAAEMSVMTKPFEMLALAAKVRELIAEI